MMEYVERPLRSGEAQATTETSCPDDRWTTVALPVGFFASVGAMYAAIGYGIYAAVQAIV